MERSISTSRGSLPPAYILAGGQSRRFGGDKALVEVNGQPQLRSLIRQLEAIGHDVRVVADREDRYSDIGVVSLVDQKPGSGPFSALLAAMNSLQCDARDASNSDAQSLLLVPCDLLCWRANWSQMLQFADASEVVCFAGQEVDGDLQPMPALYRLSLLPILRAAFDQGERSLRRWLTSYSNNKPARVQVVQVDENPRDWSFNSAAELELLLTKSAKARELD